MSVIQTPPVARISVVQCVALVVLTGLVSGFWGKVSACSLLLGGMISIVPNAYYAYMVFRHRGASAMTRVVRSIFIGEAVKLILMGAGFATAFILVDPLNIVALFAGFILIHLAGMVAVVRMQGGPQR